MVAVLGDHEALLRGVLEDPFDDVLRLVMADWYEEHGEPERGELIRLQVELTRLGAEAAAAQFLVLRERQKHLLWDGPDCNGLRWCDGFPVSVGGTQIIRGPGKAGVEQRPGKCSVVWRRGYVELIRLSPKEFARHAAGLFAVAPITEVQLLGRRPGRVFNSSEQPVGWGWANDNDRSDLGPWPELIPPPVFERLRGKNLAGLGEKVYPTDAEALADLSRACVAFGREAAGLPPLPVPP